MTQRTIIVAGQAARFPVGGVFWDYIQCLIGFLRLGYDVYYLEDSGEWNYDPSEATFTDDLSKNAAYLAENLRALGVGLERRFCLRDTYDRHWGLTREELQSVVKRATVFINISAATQLRDEYAAIPIKILVDSDPLYTQADVPGYVQGCLSTEVKEALDEMLRYDFHFSVGELIGKDSCKVPSHLFKWRPTRTPVFLDSWPYMARPEQNVFTTVLSWQPKENGPIVDGVTYGAKNVEFEKFRNLPGRTPAVLELALGGEKPPRERLEKEGWKLRDAYEVSKDPWIYRNYIQRSLAEFGIAKNAYVASRSGWFSGRSACYLSSGRPVVVQDTGFSDILPTGLGIIPFTTEEEAREGIERIQTDWELHSRAARRIAEEYFNSDAVLGSMMLEIGLARPEKTRKSDT